jgi:hypothetical protein
MTEDDLERRTHDALRRLPTPRAPRTLLPRVMAAAGGEPRRAWYAAAWRTWPHGWQAVSALAVLAAVVGVALLFAPVDAAVVREVMARLGDWPARVSMTVSRITAALDATVLVWRTIVEPVRVYVMAFVAIASMACALLGAVLVHVATERMSRT